MEQAPPVENDGSVRSFALSPSSGTATTLPAFASNEESIDVRLRDTDDAMMSFDENGNLRIDIQEPRAAWDPLIVGATVEWTSSGSTPNPAGSVEIRIPDHLFLTRDGTPYETEYLNGVIPYLRTGLSVNLGVPESPSTSPDGWQYRRDAGAHELVITNTTEIGAGTKFVCDIDYVYDTSNGYSFGTTYDDALHPVMTELSCDPARIYASVEGIGRAETPDVVLATRNILQETETKALEVFDRWHPSWSDAGLAETDLDEGGIYVVWDAKASFDHFYQPFEIEIAPNQPNAGTIVGITDLWFGNAPESVTGTLDPESLAFLDPRESNNSTSHNDMYSLYTNSVRYLDFENIEAHVAVLVQYDGAELAKGTPVELSLSTTTTLSSYDHPPQIRNASGSFEFQPIRFTSPPGNEFRLTRNANVPELAENDLLFPQQGQIDCLESGIPTRDDPDVNAAYVACYESTRAEGGDPSDVASYGENPYSIELIDDFIALENESLDAGEYEAKAILDLNAAAVTLYEGVADYMAGEYVLKPIDGAIEPLEVIVSIKNDQNEWIPALSWTQTENGRLDPDAVVALIDDVLIRPFDPAAVLENWSAADTSSQYDGQRRIDVMLPERTIGVKMSFETTAWAACVGDAENDDPRFGFTVSYAINSTEKTRGIVSEADSVTRRGANTLVVRDHTGSLIGFEGSPDDISQSSPLASKMADDDIATYGTGLFHAISATTYSRAKKSGSLLCYATNARNNPTEKTVELGRLSIEARFRTDTVETAAYGLPPSVQQPERTAIFYLLLPRGFSADVLTLRASERLSGGSSRLDSSNLPIDGGIVKDRRSITNEDGKRIWQDAPEARIESVDLSPDWRNTGRDLLKVAVEIDEGSMGYSPPFDNAQYISGFTLSLGGCYSWEALSDYGNILSFEAAYESGNENMAAWGAQTNLASDTAPSETTEQDGELWPLSELDGEASRQDRWLYANAQTTLSFPTSAEYGLGLSVKTAECPTWTKAGSGENSIEVYAGSTYQYRLRSALEEGATATDNIFYFPLESYADEKTKSAWRGTMEHIDVSALEDLGVNPRIFYSVEAEIDFSDRSARDLTDESLWSALPPESMSSVTAIAIDCSTSKSGGAFRLEGGQTLTAIVSMKAPVEKAEEIEESGGTALSQLWLESTVESATGAVSSRSLHNEYTVIRLKTLSFEFMKIDQEENDNATTRQNEERGLFGAVFDLYRLTSESTFPDSSEDIGEKNWMHVDTATSNPQVLFDGLSPGVYRLVESKAPEGYIRPASQWIITLDPLLPSGFSIENPDDEGPSFTHGEDGLALPNEKLPTLPITGAQGAAGLLATGILSIAAGIALRKRLKTFDEGLNRSHRR